MFDTHSCGCGARFFTKETRTQEIGGALIVYRRKVCHVCNTRISTAEIPYDLAKDVLAED